METKDPIETFAKYLVENKITSAQELEELQAQVKEAVEASVKFTGRKSISPLESTFEDIYAD